MIEQHSINGREVWVKVDPYHMERSNPNIIPTEYFTASYYFTDPVTADAKGDTIRDEEGEVRLFESPVAAVSHVQKQLQKEVR